MHIYAKCHSTFFIIYENWLEVNLCKLNFFANSQRFYHHIKVNSAYSLRLSRDYICLQASINNMNVLPLNENVLLSFL